MESSFQQNLVTSNMAKSVLILLTLCTALFYYKGAEASYTNFEVKRFELCNNTQGLIKFYGNVTKANGHQYLDYKISTPVPWDDSLGGSCSIEAKTLGEIYVELFTVREKDICKPFNKYLGEFWYDIERASQMAPGVCPIRAGIYQAHHLQLDFSKISLQTFPFGLLRFVLKAVDNHNKKENMWCIIIEVDNIPE